MGIFPQIGVKIRNIWNHHLVVGGFLNQPQFESYSRVCQFLDSMNPQGVNIKIFKNPPSFGDFSEHKKSSDAWDASGMVSGKVWQATFEIFSSTPKSRKRTLNNEEKLAFLGYYEASKPESVFKQKK